MSDPREQILVEELIGFVARGDSLLVMELLARTNDPLSVVDLYAQAVVDAYWKKKDLATCVILGRAGMQHAITAAAADADPERAKTLRGKAKAISYNLASFTWPGWDEPGVECSPALVAIGFDAAATNLRLARDLNRGDLPMSRGGWMLAGHHLARGDFAAAAAHYSAARDYAVAAGSAADEGLCAGFAAMVRVLQDGNDPAAKQDLEQAIAKLATLGEDGREFIRQIETAQRVFQKK